MEFGTFISLWIVILILHFFAYPLNENKEENNKDKGKEKLIPMYPIRKYLENIIIPVSVLAILYLIGFKIYK